jgi:hypothetical protein
MECFVVEERDKKAINNDYPYNASNQNPMYSGFVTGVIYYAGAGKPFARSTFKNAFEQKIIYD